MVDHRFLLSDEPLEYKVRIMAPVFLERPQFFSGMHEWFVDTMRGKYHVDLAELPEIIYSFSDYVDAVSFKLHFG